MIVTFLIIFFSILIMKYVIQYFTKPKIIEGATGQYQNYSDDPLILANKNAANIEVLKKMVNELSGLTEKVHTNTDNIEKNKQVINSLMQSMSPTNNKASQKNQKLADENPSTFNMPSKLHDNNSKLDKLSNSNNDKNINIIHS